MEKAIFRKIRWQQIIFRNRLFDFDKEKCKGHSDTIRGNEINKVGER